MAEVTLAQIAELTGGRLVGDGTRTIKGVCSPEDAKEEMLCVVWENAMLAAVPGNIPLLAEEGMLSGRDGIELKGPKNALVRILPLFDRRHAAEAGIHPTAVIHERSIIGSDVAIGPGCVISENAIIGDGASLQANVFVGRGVSVGCDATLEAGVCLQDFVVVGDRAVLHSGVAIGCDGFGFMPQPDGEWKKIPQIGAVVIEDDVEIGANSSVDRATFGETRVRRGTKLGALVHVAHNCDVGEDCVMVGFVGLGGSVTIGRNSILAGMTGVADHVTIGRGVTVAGRAGVTKDVKDGATVSGFPAQDRRQENRMQAALRRVPDYAARIRELERRLDALTGETMPSAGEDE